MGRALFPNCRLEEPKGIYSTTHEGVHVGIIERPDEPRRRPGPLALQRRQERLFAVEDFPAPDDRGVERQVVTKVRGRYLQLGHRRSVSPQRGEHNSTGDTDADGSTPRHGPPSPLSLQQRSRGSPRRGSLSSSPLSVRRGSLSSRGSRGGWEAARDATSSGRLGEARRGSTFEEGSPRGAASFTRTLTLQP